MRVLPYILCASADVCPNPIPKVGEKELDLPRMGGSRCDAKMPNPPADEVPLQED